MERLKESYKKIAESILNILPEYESFLKVILEIEIQENEINYFGFYYDKDGQRNWLDIDQLDLEDQYVHQIKNIITEMGDKSSSLKKVIYKLFPSKKFETDFLWRTGA